MSVAASGVASLKGRRMATPVVVSVGTGPGHEPHNTDPDRGLSKEGAPEAATEIRAVSLVHTRATTTFACDGPPSPTTRPVRRRAGMNRYVRPDLPGELARRPILTRRLDKPVADRASRNVLLGATDEADRIVGSTAVPPETREMFLIFVDPDHAERGIGHMLLSAARDALHAAGCKQASYYSPTRTTSALSSTRARATAPTGRVE
jgi:GNAT superfamily N-acetyltransferase